MTEDQLPSDTKLAELRQLAEGQMSFAVRNHELLVLVECAEQLHFMANIKPDEYDYDSEQFQLWAQSRAKTLIAKLEAL